MLSRSRMSRYVTLGPSLSCLAMILILLSKPVASILLWSAFALACVSLVMINVFYIRLYDQAAQNRAVSAGRESESVSRDDS